MNRETPVTYLKFYSRTEDRFASDFVTYFGKGRRLKLVGGLFWVIQLLCLCGCTFVLSSSVSRPVPVVVETIPDLVLVAMMSGVALQILVALAFVDLVVIEPSRVGPAWRLATLALGTSLTVAAVACACLGSSVAASLVVPALGQLQTSSAFLLLGLAYHARFVRDIAGLAATSEPPVGDATFQRK